MLRLRSLAPGAATVAGAAALAAALLTLLLAATGHAPGPALAALREGAVGSADAVLSATLVRATPLVWAGGGLLLTVTVWFTSMVALFRGFGSLFF